MWSQKNIRGNLKFIQKPFFTHLTILIEKKKLKNLHRLSYANFNKTLNLADFPTKFFCVMRAL